MRADFLGSYYSDVGAEHEADRDPDQHRSLTDSRRPRPPPSAQRWLDRGRKLDEIEEDPAKVRNWRPNPLFGLDNVVITPRAAYHSEEAIGTMRHFAADAVARVLTGQPPLSQVNAGELVDALWSRT